MEKVFLYLYPIKEFADVFFLGNDYYDKMNFKRPFDVLNQVIDKRYRNKSYQVIFLLYPDKDIYGITPNKSDKTIYTDITFEEVTKKYVYPNELAIIKKLDNIENLVIGGYHAQDCCKRLGELALSYGINAIIDLDLTDLFFSLYRNENYFQIESYDPERFKDFMISKSSRYGEEFAINLFNRIYNSPAYGFTESPKYQKK